MIAGRLALPALAIAIAVGLCGTACSGERASILDVPDPSVTILLMDASTSQPLRDADVSIRRINGNRCIRAPCPSDSKTWTGRSDHSGCVVISKDMIRIATAVRAGACGGDLVAGATLSARHVWVLKLRPDSTGRRVACLPDNGSS